MSPDGTRVVYTTGNENPQLNVVFIGSGSSRFYYESNSKRLPDPPGLAAAPLSTRQGRRARRV